MTEISTESTANRLPGPGGRGPSGASIETALRQLRWVVQGMIAGLVLFAVVAFVLVRQGREIGGQAVPWLFPALGGVLLASILGGALVRRIMGARLQALPGSGSRAERLASALPIYRAWTLVSAALAEAPALFGIVAYLVSGSLIGLLVTALGILRLIVMLPSEAALATLAEALTKKQ